MHFDFEKLDVSQVALDFAAILIDKEPVAR